MSAVTRRPSTWVWPILAFAAVVVLAIGTVVVLPRLRPPHDTAAPAPTGSPGVGVFGEIGPSTPSPAASSSQPPPPPDPTGATNPRGTARQANIDLLTGYGFGEFALSWLDVMGTCIDNKNYIQQWQRDQGMQVKVVCRLLASTAAGGQTITFYRYERADQARTGMICQKPAGSPSAVNPTEVDLPGSTGGAAGWYCEYAANNEPADQHGDLGICWTDGSLPLGAEINWQQVPFAEGGTYLEQLRATWRQYS